MLREMNDDPLRIIAAQHGVFLYREALEAGYSKSTITRMHRSGTWHRVRHGAYCFGDEWAALSAVGRHLVLARAVRRTTPGVIAFSHTTALLLHGVDVWGAALGRVHVTRVDDGAHRSERDVVHHVGECTPDEVGAVRGLPTVNVTRAVLEHAALVPTESGLVSANSALHLGLTTPPDLRTCRDRFEHWPGAQRWHVVLHHMDGRVESVGETRSLHLFWRQGLPRPDLQRAVSMPAATPSPSPTSRGTSSCCSGSSTVGGSSCAACARERPPAMSCSARSVARTRSGGTPAGASYVSPGPTWLRPPVQPLSSAP